MKSLYEYANWQRTAAAVSDKLGPGVVVTDKAHEFEILGFVADHVLCFVFPDGFRAAIPVNRAHMEESDAALMDHILEEVKRLHEAGDTQ